MNGADTDKYEYVEIGNCFKSVFTCTSWDNKMDHRKNKETVHKNEKNPDPSGDKNILDGPRLEGNRRLIHIESSSFTVTLL